MRTKHYVPDLQKVVIANAASRTGHCEEVEGRRGNLFLSFPRRRESIYDIRKLQSCVSCFSLLNRWPFTPYLQGHRPCILGEAYASSYFRLSGPRTPPHPAQTLFTKFARRPGCAGRRISNPDYLCFSLSTRRPGLLPASAIFALCFVFLLFDFCFFICFTIRYL